MNYDHSVAFKSYKGKCSPSLDLESKIVATSAKLSCKKVCLDNIYCAGY